MSVRLEFQLKSEGFLAGSVVRQFALQHLSVEWRRRYRLHLPRSACIYSGLVVCRWGARYTREGAERGCAPCMPAFCNGSQGAQLSCLDAIPCVARVQSGGVTSCRSMREIISFLRHCRRKALARIGDL